MFLVPDFIPARVVLYILSFTGFLVSFMMRTDMNMAIVAMAKIHKKTENSTSAESYCYDSANATLDEDFDVSGIF